MDTVTEDLAREALAWLLAQYEDIEHTAREAGRDDVPEWAMHNGRVIGADPRYHSMIVDRSVEPTPWQRHHIATNDPRSVVADIAAKQLILAEVCRDKTDAGRQRARHIVLRFAAALAHRPGYCADWQVPDQDAASTSSLERLARVVTVTDWGRR